jgi:hypothetical protein
MSGNGVGRALPAELDPMRLILGPGPRAFRPEGRARPGTLSVPTVTPRIRALDDCILGQIL